MVEVEVEAVEVEVERAPGSVIWLGRVRTSPIG